MKTNTNILGANCLPLVKRSQYGIANWDHSRQYEYLTGEERLRYVRRFIDGVVKEQRKINREQHWYIHAVKSDGTYDLRSDHGYEHKNVSRSDFRLIN